eukprot:COSAG01_NODE_6057_length_3876_cov_2.004766_5_plen_50_part_00
MLMRGSIAGLLLKVTDFSFAHKLLWSGNSQFFEYIPHSSDCIPPLAIFH